MTDERRFAAGALPRQPTPHSVHSRWTLVHERRLINALPSVVGAARLDAVAYAAHRRVGGSGQK